MGRRTQAIVDGGPRRRDGRTSHRRGHRCILAHAWALRATRQEFLTSSNFSWVCNPLGGSHPHVLAEFGLCPHESRSPRHRPAGSVAPTGTQNGVPDWMDRRDWLVRTTDVSSSGAHRDDHGVVIDSAQPMYQAVVPNHRYCARLNWRSSSHPDSTSPQSWGRAQRLLTCRARSARHPPPADSPLCPPNLGGRRGRVPA